MRRTFSKIMFLSFAALLSSRADACEPILPFMYTVGGPGVLLQSISILALAVAMKSILFALFQSRLSFERGALFMLMGNVLSTAVGVVAAVMIGVGPFAWLAGIPVAFVLCWLPARRASRFLNLSVGAIATLMTVGMAGSCALFITSQFSAVRGELFTFWGLKLAAVYLALVVSIALSTFWEEWTIWKLSGVWDDEACFVQPALKANLCVLLCIMIYAAALMIPLRKQYENYLVPQILTVSIFLNKSI